MHWQLLLFSNLTLTIPAVLPVLLPKECQRREEVCTPGEFNLTMPLIGRKERKATTEKNTAKKQNLGRRRKSNETNNVVDFLCDIF